MSYETEHDFGWLFQALGPRGQIPGTRLQELPHVVSDIIHPKLDALGWLRYSEVVFETAFTTNSSLVNHALVPSGEAHLYLHANARATGGDPPAGSSVTVVLVNGAQFAAVGPSRTDPLSGHIVAALTKPVVVPTGFNLGLRASAAAGVGVSWTLEAWKIILPVGEYILPS